MKIRCLTDGFALMGATHLFKHITVLFCPSHTPNLFFQLVNRVWVQPLTVQPFFIAYIEGGFVYGGYVLWKPFSYVWYNFIL